LPEDIDEGLISRMNKGKKQAIGWNVRSCLSQPAEWRGNPDEGQIEERIYQVVLLSNDIRGRSYPSLALLWIQKRGKIDISI